MLYARRATQFFERLANPDEQSQAPAGVLLYSPNLLRFVAACCYLIWVAAFINNFFVSDFFARSFSDEKTAQLFYAQLGLVIVGAIGTGLILIFARSHYRDAMFVSSMLAISSSMAATAFMFGLNINPHMLLAVTPLLVIGFTVGRDGLLLSAIWIGMTYIFLQLADGWGWWPRPTSINIDIVRHENLSAFIILLLVVLATQFYVVKIGITLRKQGELHSELEERQGYQLELLSRIVTTQDEERRRIAQNLHEGPVQDIAALRLAIRNDASQDDLIAMIDEMVTQLRTVSVNLYPATLDLYGLSAALDQLAAQQEQAGHIHIDVRYPNLDYLDRQVGIVLFRIAQEALNNIRKHSSAKHASIQLEEDNGILTLKVRDDGQGFNVEPTRRQALQTGHLGLATLRELALSVGGTLNITSEPGQGTTVTVSLPSRQLIIHEASEQPSNSKEENRSFT